MMLAPPKGNIGFVREELRKAMIQHYEAEMTDHARRANPADAEIDDTSEGNWYLVHTFPGDDAKAMRWLARRRFGVFRPMQQRKSPHREGQSIGVMEAVFPGWLFVYVWDVRKHHSRITSLPGVHDILTDPVTQNPVPIPDRFVQKLRALAWLVEDRLTHVGQESDRHQQKRQVRRPSTKERKQLDKLKKQFKAAGLEWDQSTWEHVNALEPRLRIALMHRTITSMLPVVG